MNAERKRKVLSLGLEYDPEYLELSDAQTETICNGCGPIKQTNYFIPQSFVGLDISEACNIHDYDYVTKHFERKKWDDRFLANMFKIIESDKTAPWLVQNIRYTRARMYYWIVRAFGGTVFDVAKEYFK